MSEQDWKETTDLRRDILLGIGGLLVAAWLAPLPAQVVLLMFAGAAALVWMLALIMFHVR